MKYTLRTRVDDATGETGLVVAGLPVTDMPMVAVGKGAGLQIAHDLVEHMNGVTEIGGIGDELEALGAVWFVRGVTGMLRRNSMSMFSTEQNLASDVSRMAVLYMQGEDYARYVPRTKPCIVDDTLLEIIEFAKIEAASEMRDITDVDRETRRRLGAYYRDALHFMRAGYRKAVRKYGSTNRANNLFWNVADAIDQCLRHTELVGQDLELSIVGLMVRCSEHRYDTGY